MQKLFINDRFFLACTVFGVLGSVFSAVATLVAYPEWVLAALADLLRSAFVAVLYLSYRKHQKNVMKGTMGSVLALLSVDALARICNAFDELEIYLAAVYLVFTLAVTANHYVINSEHRAKPAHIVLNQFCFACVAFTSALIGALNAGTFGAENPTMCVAELVRALAFVAAMAAVVCVESRLDAYRRNREAAGWSEEKGYPEGHRQACEK